MTNYYPGMTRLQADLLLIFVTIIWGAGFVAQKVSFEQVGAFTFVAGRFLISALLVLPLALREHRKSPRKLSSARPGDLALLCLALFAAASFQQAGLATTSVTNTGFLTGLYVVFTPLICWAIYRHKLSFWIIPASLISILGVWLLSGTTAETLSHINRGDILVLLCAVAFAWHITLVGHIMQKSPAPFRLAFLQFIAVAIAAGAVAAAIEHPEWKNIWAAAIPILFAGVVAGGIGFTIQIVAQQHTPASDSAIILSGEALFAAVFGVLMTGDRLTTDGWTGCALIFGAILVVEFGPVLSRRFKV